MPSNKNLKLVTKTPKLKLKCLFTSETISIVHRKKKHNFNNMEFKYNFAFFVLCVHNIRMILNYLIT